MWCDEQQARGGLRTECLCPHTFLYWSLPPHNTVVLGSRASQEVLKVKDNPKDEAWSIGSDLIRKDTRTDLLYYPVIPPLGIHSEKTLIQNDTNTPVLTEALFTIDRTWKQPKGPSVEERIKMWCTCTVEYHSAIKRNETGLFVEMWLDLESVTQSEVSQREITKHHILMHMCGI